MFKELRLIDSDRYLTILTEETIDENPIIFETQITQSPQNLIA